MGVDSSKWYYRSYVKVVNYTGYDFKFTKKSFIGNEDLSRSEMAVGVNKILNIIQSNLFSKHRHSFQKEMIKNNNPEATLVRYSSKKDIYYLIAQVTSVSQFNDVDSSDWFYEDLKSLVERFGVIAGYSDGGFKPSNKVSRGGVAELLRASADTIFDEFPGKCQKQK